ncbi:MAG TPA: hypothetical protein PKZ12_08140 [Smithellaceae bacterium]|nr:hypothetical protein [Smithellaceae bacterium]
MNNEFNEKLTRCPRLGQEVIFSYCLQESGELPCPRIMHCWSHLPSLEKLLQHTLKPEQWDKFINRQTPDKISSLIEIIEAAKAKK